jgi:hypothetical protein
VGLLEQMAAVDRLVRRPADLAALASAGGDDAAVLSTIDRARLDAVSRMQAALTLGRWWLPRFPGTVESLAGALGQDALATTLVASPRFEQAEGEDVKGTAFALAVLDALEAGAAEDAPWVADLLAYEYLLAIGLPRRAQGLDVDAAVEAKLLAQARWFEGGRLARRIVALPVAWPVGAWHEGTVEDEDPEPRVHALAVVDDEVAEVEAPPQTLEALAMLADGADDKTLAGRIGKKNATKLLGWLRDAEMLK